MLQENIKSSSAQKSTHASVVIEDEIRNRLESAGCIFRLTKTHFEIQQCPFCHPDTSDPSNQWKLGVLRRDGAYNCFRCNSKGSWSALRQKLFLISSDSSGIDNTSKALQIWLETIAGSDDRAKPLIKYLKSRGLSGSVPESIRLHPSLPHFDHNTNRVTGKFPAMVAKVNTKSSETLGVHRTYLTEDGAKAPVKDPKMSLGKIKGGGIFLGDYEDTIGVSEGIETALAVYEQTGTPMVAAVSASGMATIEIPPSVRTVHIFGDQDRSGTGQRAAETLARRLYDLGKTVFIHIPPEALLDAGQKSKDWLDVHNFSPAEKLINKYMNKREPWVPSSTTPPITEPERPNNIDEAGYYGLAGELVKKMEPNTEADPAALLTTILVSFGNVVGHHPYYSVGSVRQRCNLFAASVGDTSVGRKGTAAGEVSNQFREVVPAWFKECRKSGLSSGEGVIHHVRDQVEKEKQIKDPKSGTTTTERVIVDEGILDKRLLVTESEFASVLQLASRDSNILSTILRQAWDGGTLSTLSKNSPETATDAHISIIAHITSHELRRRLSETDQLNGFGNRFLWICVKRSKYLAFPKDPNDMDFSDLRERLQQAIQYAQGVGRISMSRDSEKIYAAVYPRLSTPPAGLFGAMIARAAPQVLRLASIYALLDKSNIIEVVHLRAALAVWDYCEASCKYLFGNFLGNSTSNRIIQELRDTPEGLSRTEIRDLFDRHKKSSEIQEALDLLKFEGLADMQSQQTPGRPIERWFATEHLSRDRSDQSAERYHLNKNSTLSALSALNAQETGSGNG